MKRYHIEFHMLCFKINKSQDNYIKNKITNGKLQDPCIVVVVHLHLIREYTTMIWIIEESSRMDDDAAIHSAANFSFIVLSFWRELIVWSCVTQSKGIRECENPKTKKLRKLSALCGKRLCWNQVETIAKNADHQRLGLSAGIKLG